MDEPACRAQAVRPLLLRLLGRDPGPLVHQPFGHANVTFALPDLGLVAKTSDNLAAFDHTAANVRVLGALGIPVPKIVAHGHDGAHAALILKWIPGQDLRYALPTMTTAQKRHVATGVAEIQRRATSLPPGRGYGWTPIGVPGPFPTWLAVVERDHARLPERLRERIDLDPWRDVLEEIPPTPFLDDLTVKNVIVHEGRLQGIVDLDRVCYGDPLFGLALAETTAVLDCDDWDYGRLLRRAWSAPYERADLYAAIFAAGFLARAPSGRLRLFFERRLARANGKAP